MAHPDLARLTRVLARLHGRPEPELRSAFVLATAADLPSVLELRRQVLGRELSWDDAAYLRWRYFPEAGSDTPANRLWVFHGPEGEVQGAIGTEPVDLHLGGEVLPTHRFMDVMVRPRWNGLGLGAWMNLVLQDQHEHGFVVGATPDSYNLVRRVFHPLPERRAWKLLVRSEDFLARKAPRLSHVPGLTEVVDGALAVRRRLGRWLRSPAVQVEEATDLTADAAAIDALDASLASAGMVFERRTARYLTWRYLRNPRRRYKIWLARRPGSPGDGAGRLAGLLVTRTLERRGELVEWLWNGSLPEPARTESMVALFGHGVDQLARERVVTVWTRMIDPFSEALVARAGLSLRADRDTVAVFASSPARLHQLTNARWFLTLGNSDDD